MRELFERLLVSATPASRVLLAVWASTPFFVIVLLAHGWALTSDEVRAGLNAGPMWALQALLLACVALNLTLAWRLWPRRGQRERVPRSAMLVCLSIGVGYTALTILSGTFTTCASVILVGVLAIGLLIFPMSTMFVAYLVCTGLIVGHDVGVLLGLWAYAPALGPQAFVSDQPTWWLTAWREYVFYAGYVVLLYLLLLLFSRLDDMHASLIQLSHTDELTGLANRRRFMQAVQAELVRQGRSGQPMCVALLDADHFKRVNDRFGHHAGDEVLRTLGAVMLGSVRTPTDVAARLGGEEFALLLPDTRLEDARRVCERLRSTLAAQRFRAEGQNYRVTVSIGLVESRGQDADAILAAADRQLYQAKTEGRNRVCCMVSMWGGA